MSYLSGRVNEPTEEDEAKLERVLNYLYHTKGDKMWLRGNKGQKEGSGSSDNELGVEAYVDASFGNHEDCKSRTGVVIMAAGAGVAMWSTKQKMVTKSSTESEIVGLSCDRRRL